MVRTALIILCGMMVSCSGFIKNARSVPIKYDSQFLYWCEQDGEWPVYATKPESCSNISRGKWDKLPITVNAENSLIVETLQAVGTFNDQVGFELFRFEVSNTDPDIGVIAFGAHYYAAMEAKHFTLNGRHTGAVLVYNGMEHKDRSDIMVHELGHLAGLKHDHNDIDSIMFPTSALRTARLQRIDVQALREMYGI